MNEENKYKLYFEWICQQHWFQSEAEFRLSLPDIDGAGDFQNEVELAIEKELIK